MKVGKREKKLCTRLPWILGKEVTISNAPTISFISIQGCIGKKIAYIRNSPTSRNEPIPIPNVQGKAGSGG